MAEIDVVTTSDGDPMRFTVSVRERGSATEHEVTLSRADAERLGAGRSPEELVRACFVFLLEREPKESILRAFDVREIGRYFPEFEETIARDVRLEAGKKSIGEPNPMRHEPDVSSCRMENCQYGDRIIDPTVQ